MPVCAATVPVLILIYNIFCAKADLLLTVSRPEHVGPLSIKGSANETCRSVVEGANRCFLTEDCRGIVLYKSGTEKLCQTAICLPGPDVGSVNQVPGEAKIFLLFNGTFATAPDVKILMEDNSFTISAPSGDIPATVVGTPAPRLVPGKVGSALRLDGAELNYGRPNECFYDINLCTNGLSVSLWVKYYSIKDPSGGAPDGEGVILDGGGFYPESQGLHLSRNGYTNFQVMIFDNAWDHYGNVPYGDEFAWKHLVFTWEGQTFPIALYQNGCLGKGVSLLRPVLAPRTETQDFKIGGNGKGGEIQRGDIALDNVLMWYHALTPEEVWQLYVQGGEV